MERPKFLEYRHRRDQVTQYTVKRELSAVLEKPSSVLLRMVGKKKSATKDTYNEEWLLELRVSDVHPDYSGLVKTQVKEAKRFVKNVEVGYEGISDPTTEFLNETVDRFGILREIAGTLPTPHVLLFPEEAQGTGGEWQRSRKEMLPKCTPEGVMRGAELMDVTYRGRVDKYGDDGTEFADIAVTATGGYGESGDPVWQEYELSGNLRFAIRDGHIISGTVVRSMKSHFDIYTLTQIAVEEFEHLAQETERSVGGMRL